MLELSGRTKILGLIADPVAQARSPALTNALLDRRGRLGEFVFLPMHVAASGLAPFVAALRHLENFAGAVVSMPHKVAIASLLDELVVDGALVGAVNTIRRQDDGRLVGTTLDGEGFVRGLRAAGHEVSGARVLLAGAGGAASAIAFALARHGCGELFVSNRTSARADALAARVSREFPRVSVASGVPPAGRLDLVVNATSLGMQAGDELPVAESVIGRAELVAECVVARDVTPLLEVARAKGVAVHPGLPMLQGQLELILDFIGVS